MMKLEVRKDDIVKDKEMSSYLVNKIIFESILKEVGELKDFSYDFKGPLKYGISDYRYNYPIWSEDKTTYNVVDMVFEDVSEMYQKRFSAYHDHSSIYNVYYTVDNNEIQSKKTDYKSLVNILSTNLKIIEDFISRFKPGILLVNGNHKTEYPSLRGDSQKSQLYGAILDKQINKVDEYEFTHTILEGKRFYVIFKVKD